MTNFVIAVLPKSLNQKNDEPGQYKYFDAYNYLENYSFLNIPKPNFFLFDSTQSSLTLINDKISTIYRLTLAYQCPISSTRIETLVELAQEALEGNIDCKALCTEIYNYFCEYTWFTHSGSPESPNIKRSLEKIYKKTANVQILTTLCFYYALEKNPLLSSTLEMILRDNKQDTLALTLMGKEYVRGSTLVEKNIQRAVECWEEAWRIDSKNNMLSVLISYYMTGSDGFKKDFAKALKYALKVIELQPKNVSLLKKIAMIYLKGGDNVPIDINSALEYILKAIEIEPDDNKSFEILDAIGSYVDGVSALKTFGYKYLNGTDNYRKNSKLALELFQRVLKANSTNVEILQRVGELYLCGDTNVRQDIRRALEHLNKAHHLEKKNTDILGLLGSCYLLSKTLNLKLARNCFEQVLEINPADPFAHAQLGFISIEEKDFKQAKMYFQKASELDPENTFARTQLIAIEHVLSVGRSEGWGDCDINELPLEKCESVLEPSKQPKSKEEQSVEILKKLLDDEVDDFESLL